MVLLDIGDKDLEANWQPVTFASLTDATGAPSWSNNTATYNSSRGIVQYILVSGFIRMKPDDAGGTDPNVKVIVNLEADGDTTDPQVHCFPVVADATDTSTSRVYFSIPIPVQLKFETELVVTASYLDTGTAALKDSRIKVSVGGIKPR